MVAKMVYPLQALIPAIALVPILWGKVSWSLEKVGYNEACKVTSRKLLAQYPTPVPLDFDVSGGGVGYEIRKLDASSSFSSRGKWGNGIYSQQQQPYPYLNEPDRKPKKKTDYNPNYFRYSSGDFDPVDHPGPVLSHQRNKATALRAQVDRPPPWGSPTRPDAGGSGNIWNGDGYNRPKWLTDVMKGFQEESSTARSSSDPPSTFRNEPNVDDQTTQMDIELSSTERGTSVDISSSDGSSNSVTEESSVGADRNEVISTSTETGSGPVNMEDETTGTSAVGDDSISTERSGSVGNSETVGRTDEVTTIEPGTNPSTLPTEMEPTTMSSVSETPISNDDNAMESSSTPMELNTALTTMSSDSEADVFTTAMEFQTTTATNDNDVTASEVITSSIPPPDEMPTSTTIIISTSFETERPLDDEVKMTETTVNTEDTGEAGASETASPTNQPDTIEETTTPLSPSTESNPPSLTTVPDSTTSTITMTTTEDTVISTESYTTTEKSAQEIISSTETTVTEQPMTQSSVSSMEPEMETPAAPSLSSTTTDSKSEPVSSPSTTTIPSEEMSSTGKPSSEDNQICDDSLWLRCDMNTQHCKCNPGMIYDSERKVCVSLAGKECKIGANTEQKFCVKNAECSQSGGGGVCKCSEGFLPTGEGNGNCLPGLDMPCESSSNPCHPELQCSSKKCICRDGFVQGKPGSSRCYLDFNANCTGDEERSCNAFAFLNCSESAKTCTCQDPENQKYENETRSCVATSGQRCMVKNDLQGRLLKCVKNSNCNLTSSGGEGGFGTCECIPGFENDWKGNCFLKSSAPNIRTGPTFLIPIIIVFAVGNFDPKKNFVYLFRFCGF